MNKQTIIDSYFHRKQNTSCVQRFCKEYPLYSTQNPLIPEFLKNFKKEEFGNEQTREETILDSVSHTVSFVSGLSRAKMDSILFNEIVMKRKEHMIFCELEKEDIKERKWFFIDDFTKTYFGPFNSIEMDNYFQIHKINPKTKIKRKNEDDDYFNLSTLIQRYHKNILVNKFNFEKKEVSMSNKLKKFKKGQILAKKNNFHSENYNPSFREERTFSLATRPNLIYLTDMLPEDSDEDEEEEHCYSRLRSQTLVN